MLGIRPVSLHGVIVGDGHPTVFVAEIGAFFNQDIELAERYLSSIAEEKIFKVFHRTFIFSEFKSQDVS